MINQWDEMKSLQQILMFLLIFFQISCASYRDFSKEYDVQKPFDFTDPEVYKHFELGEEYRIKLKSNSKMDVAVIQILENHLVGIPIKNPSDSTVEILFEDIHQASKKDYKRDRRGVLTSIPMVTIMGVVLLAATLVTISISN
jgi:hypothetical protein